MRRAILLLTVLALGASGAGAEPPEPPFDHVGTRFPLTNAHERTPCESCHQDGVFLGTPTQCQFCHDGTGRRALTGKDTSHVRSPNTCDDCHTTASWAIVRFDHGVVAGPCLSCHNGIQATGKHARHLRTQADCDACHFTLAWTPAHFDHDDVTQPCSQCHNGIDATGKPGDHVPTNQECDVCHTTRRWSPTNFDHAGITDPCSTCHNGVIATGKDPGHFVTNEECDVCHRTGGWFMLRYTHQTMNFPAGHREQLVCKDCHQAGTEDAFRFPGLAPDCGGCHRNDYERDEHKKVDTPKIYYTVSELRDCTGACHIYKDETLSEIEDRRNGEHRVGDSEFDD